MFTKRFIDDNELYIANIINKGEKCKNIVTIFSASKDGIIMEELDIMKEYDEFFLEDIKSAMKQLHQKGIVYIDFKTDNIGWSLEDKCWKLFDFDCSGVCTLDGKKWISEPILSHRYKKFKTCFKDSLFEIDEISYESEFNDFLKNKIQFFTSLLSNE